MSRGVLIFAFNNQHIDYVRLAAWNTNRVHEFLNLPVCLVTDTQSLDNRAQWFDKVLCIDKPNAGTRYFEDIADTVAWHNHQRYQALAISPWEETLVLDADYVVASNQLLTLFDCKQDFMCHKSALDIKTGASFNETFGQYRMPMWWATVMLIRPSIKTQAIFSMIEMIQQHWDHYRNLYQINRSTFRNDHALSIALNLVSGYMMQAQDIAWPLLSVMPTYQLMPTDNPNKFCVEWISNQRSRHVMVQDQDFHAMGKTHLIKIMERHGV